jgi:hypothetical protein
MSFGSITEPEKADDPGADLEVYKLVTKMHSGANWFFWIAGMSMVNSLILLFEGGWSFIVGLGITQLFDGVALAFSEDSEGSMAIARIIAICLDVGVAFVFVLFGVFARKQLAWAFIAGMVFYVADALIFLLVQDWLSIGFHAFALFFIFGGYTALKRLSDLEPSEYAP